MSAPEIAREAVEPFGGDRYQDVKRAYSPLTASVFADALDALDGIAGCAELLVAHEEGSEMDEPGLVLSSQQRRRLATAVHLLAGLAAAGLAQAAKFEAERAR